MFHFTILFMTMSSVAYRLTWDNRRNQITISKAVGSEHWAAIVIQDTSADDLLLPTSM